MAANDALIQMLGGGGAPSNANIVSALQGAAYQPSQDPLGIAALTIGQSAPALINPYASTGSNITGVLGAGLISALLGGLARNETNAQNVALSGMESQFLSDPSQRQALLAQEPRLGALQNVLLAQSLERANKVADLQATGPVENQMAIARAQGLAPVTLQSEIDKANALAPITVQTDVAKAQGLLPINVEQHTLDAAGDAAIALHKELGESVDPLTGAVTQLMDPAQVAADRAGAVKAAEMAAEQPYKDKVKVPPGTIDPKEIANKALEINTKIANSPQAANLIEANDRFNSMLSLAKQDTAPASIAMIKNFAKILDPRAVIRESTFDIIADPGSPALGLQDYMNELKTGGRLSPEHRSQLITAAVDNLGALNQGYRTYAQSELGTFGNVGGDPSLIKLIDPPSALPTVPSGAVLAGYNPNVGKFQIKPLPGYGLNPVTGQFEYGGGRQ